MMDKAYKEAYDKTMSDILSVPIVKQAGVKDWLKALWAGTKLYALSHAVPIALAGGAGLAVGAGLNRFGRRIDPTIADSNTKDDIKRVERLRRIQYYNALSNQLAKEKDMQDSVEDDNNE